MDISLHLSWQETWELLGHVVALCLIFCSCAKLRSKVAALLPPHQQQMGILVSLCSYQVTLAFERQLSSWVHIENSLWFQSKFS